MAAVDKDHEVVAEGSAPRANEPETSSHVRRERRAVTQPSVSPEEKRISRAAEAMAEIQDRLADLTYPPGSTFTEAEVAAELGMTKTPVREALLMLVATGLVTARPGAGYRVLPITLRDIRALCGHWRRLGGDAASLVARDGIDSHTSQFFGDLVEGEDEESIGEGPAKRLVLLHIQIAYQCNDPYLTRDFLRLTVEIERLLRLVFGDGDESLLDDVPDILGVLLNEDVKAARAVMIAHVDRVERLVIDQLMTSGVLMSTNLGQGANR